MVQKNKTARKPVPASEDLKMKRHPVKKAAATKMRKQAVRKNPQPRVWRRVAKLSADALMALEAGNLTEVRGCLEAIRAVGLCAEEG